MSQGNPKHLTTLLLSTTLFLLVLITHSQWVFLPFHHSPNAAFHTFQFTPPNFSTQPALSNGPLPGSNTLNSPTSSISLASAPTDRLSRVLEPNVFNSGSSSTGLNDAMKFYMDEQYRIGLEHIDLTREQSILQGSPRSLSDPGLASRSRSLNTLGQSVQTAATRSISQSSTFTPQVFKMDLMQAVPSSTSITPPTDAAAGFKPDDLPSPSLLMNPQVQNQVQSGLRNMTDIFTDLKGLFTPSKETSSTLNTLLKDAPSASEVSSGFNSISSNAPRGGSPSPPSRGSSSIIDLGGLTGGLGRNGGGGLGGLGSVFDFL